MGDQGNSALSAAEDEQHLESFEAAERREDAAGSLALEVERLSARVRALEAQLRTEKHEHAETREELRQVEDALSAAGYPMGSRSMDRTERPGAAGRIASMAMDLADTRSLLALADRQRDDAREWAEQKDHSHGLAIGREQDLRQRIGEAIAVLSGAMRAETPRPTAYDLNPSAAQLSRLEHQR